MEQSHYLEDYVSSDDVIALANASRGSDQFGLRAEFVNLVRAAHAARP
jgi:hypothetical protein